MEKPHREYGPSDFAPMLRGLADAAKRVALEEKLIREPIPKDRRVN